MAPDSDDATVSLRLLCDRCEELATLRTQAVCRLPAELTPGGMRRDLAANKAQALLARIRPADDVTAVGVHVARDHLADTRALDARLKYIGGQIATARRRVGHRADRVSRRSAVTDKRKLSGNFRRQLLNADGPGQR
jgi:hypothetical protein